MSLEGMQQAPQEHVIETGAAQIVLGDRIQTAEGVSAVTRISQRPSGEFDVALANGVDLVIDANDSISVVR